MWAVKGGADVVAVPSIIYLSVRFNLLLVSDDQIQIPTRPAHIFPVFGFNQIGALSDSNWFKPKVILRPENKDSVSLPFDHSRVVRHS
jgi:hypothetical protein